MTRIQHSGFWIVSTHVGTAGFAAPIMFWLLAMPIVAFAKLTGPLDLDLWVLGLAQFVGSVFGTRLSLSNLKRTASSSHWSKYTAPSAIAFVFAIGAAFAVNLIFVIPKGPWTVDAFLFAQSALCLVGDALFWTSTASAFRTFDIDQRCPAG